MAHHPDTKHHYAGDLDRLLSASSTTTAISSYHHDQASSSHDAGRIHQDLHFARSSDINSTNNDTQTGENDRNADAMSMFKTEESFEARVQMQPQLQSATIRNSKHEDDSACQARSRAGTKRNYVGMTSKEDDDANVDDGFDSNDEDEDPDCLSDYPQRSATMGQRPLAKPFNKKNLKRHRLSHSETRFLLNQFGQNPHPDATQRAMLAKQIHGLSARQIQVWFQNRRAKLKRMSAADADRMLSTRSYPEGYGPQGFGTSMSMASCENPGVVYAQHVAEMFPVGGRDFDNRAVYARNASHLMTHYSAHPRISDLPSREGSTYDANTRRTQLGPRTYTQYGTTLGDDYSLGEDMTSQHGCSPANAAQISSPSPYEQSDNQNVDSTTNAADLSTRGHGPPMPMQYPRSVPAGETYHVYSSMPSQCSVDMMDSPQTPEHYKYHHPHGELPYNLRDSDVHESIRIHQARQAELQPFQGTYYTPVHGSRMVATSMLPYPQQQYMTSSGLGARRVTQDQRFTSPGTSMQEDAHYYYGSEEHIKHEQNECKDALQLQDGAQSDLGSHCSISRPSAADASDFVPHEEGTDQTQ